MNVGPTKYIPGGTVKFGRYDNDEIAIEIMALDGSGEAEAAATVNMAPYGAPLAGPEHVWLKGWTENEGLPEALVKAGVCTLAGVEFTYGHAPAQLAKLSDEALAEIAAAKGPTCSGIGCNSTDIEMRYDINNIATGSYCQSCYDNPSKYHYRKDQYFDPSFAGESLEPDDY